LPEKFRIFFTALLEGKSASFIRRGTAQRHEKLLRHVGYDYTEPASSGGNN